MLIFIGKSICYLNIIILYICTVLYTNANNYKQLDFFSLIEGVGPFLLDNY
jgi:hypothetical protein